jgi:hypothetical protein
MGATASGTSQFPLWIEIAVGAYFVYRLLNSARASRCGAHLRKFLLAKQPDGLAGCGARSLSANFTDLRTLTVSPSHISLW